MTNIGHSYGSQHTDISNYAAIDVDPDPDDDDMYLFDHLKAIFSAADISLCNNPL